MLAITNRSQGCRLDWSRQSTDHEWRLHSAHMIACSHLHTVVTICDAYLHRGAIKPPEAGTVIQRSHETANVELGLCVRVEVQRMRIHLTGSKLCGETYQYSRQHNKMLTCHSRGGSVIGEPHHGLLWTRFRGFSHVTKYCEDARSDRYHFWQRPAEVKDLDCTPRAEPGLLEEFHRLEISRCKRLVLTAASRQPARVSSISTSPDVIAAIPFPINLGCEFRRVYAKTHR